MFASADAYEPFTERRVLLLVPLGPEFAFIQDMVANKASYQVSG